MKIETIKGVIMKIETIHNSLVNGQRRQAVEQIGKYGKYDFFHDYRDYLDELYTDPLSANDYFSDMVISYFHITER